jgi:hypothetical protein
MIRGFLARTLPLWLCAALPLFGDVTLRFDTTMKPGPLLPQQAREQIEKSMKASGGNMMLQMKNGKGLSRFGRWISIAEFAKEQMTLIDTVQHSYFTTKASEFGDLFAAAMPKMPDEAKKAMESMKISFTSKKTGRTETILGVATEERELVINIETPQGPVMKNVMQFWTARPDSSLTNAAIRELMGYNLWSYSFMNPASMMQKMSGSAPGFADAMKSVMDELSKNNSVILRSRVAMHIKMPPEVLRKLAADAPGAPATIDPDAPMFETIQEAVELSSAPVDAAVFQIPSEYKTVPAVELIKTMIEAQKEAASHP